MHNVEYRRLNSETTFVYFYVHDTKKQVNICSQFFKFNISLILYNLFILCFHICPLGIAYGLHLLLIKLIFYLPFHIAYDSFELIPV